MGNEIADHKKDFLAQLRSVFVGRDKELIFLRDLLEKMKQGEGNFVMITGEAGTGKSALVRKFAAEATEAGVTFISENFGNIPFYEPYKPFLQIIGKLGGSNLQKLMELVHSQKESEQREAKNTGENSWDAEALYSLQSEKALAQQLLVANLIEISRKKPLLISLTDIHRAPLSTWQFLHYLTHRIMENRIMIILTLRQDGKVLQPERVPAYADVLQRMNREGLVRKLQLSRLGKADLRKFIRSLFQRTDFTNHFVPLVLKVTGGVPEQIATVFQFLLEKKYIYQLNGVWFNRPNLSEERLLRELGAAGEPEAILNNLTHLSIAQKTLLDYCAVLSAPFDHHILAAMLNISTVTVLKELQSLAEQKILLAAADGAYDFRRPALRAVILDRIPAESRKALHREVAQLVEVAEHLDEVRKVYTLAFHYSQAEDPHLAFCYLHRAGDTALKHFAFSEARDYFRRAIQLIDLKHHLGSQERLAALFTKSAWIERVLGNREESLLRCQLARKLLNLDKNTSWKIQLYLQEGFSHLWLNHWDEAKKCFNTARKMSRESNLFEHAIANLGLGIIHFELSDYKLARRYYEQTLRLAHQLNAIKLEANVLNNLGVMENVRGHFLRAIGLYSKSIPLFRKLGDNEGLAKIYHNIGMTHAEEGDWQEANKFYGKSLSVSDEMGLQPLKSVNFLNRASALAHLKKFEEAREYNFKAQRLLTQMRDELGLAEYLKIQGVIEREEGNWEKASQYFQLALKKFDALENKLGRAETEFELVLLAEKTGDRKILEKWATQSMESFNSLGIEAKARMIRKMFLSNDQMVHQDLSVVLP